MIYDKLTNIQAYAGFHPNLDIAIEFITSHDLSKLPPGQTEVSGRQVYINVMETAATPGETRQYEIHRNYMDIQIDLSGTEMIQIGNSSGMEVFDYDPETDFGTAACKDSASCIMGPGHFIICMASEPHKPGISVLKDTQLKKCVFKVHR